MSQRRLQKESDSYLSVTEVARLVNDILEASFPQLLFRGELSQITTAPSGHMYFTIKDEGAQMACVMWASSARALQFRPVIGTAVRCHGRPNVYAQSGRLQIIVQRMTLDGEGELQRRFLELKARLEKEGFFATERKRPLPFLPRAVGLVTSKTGAVIHDMMVKIRERFPAMVVYLVDTRVQGDGAAEEIAAAIRKLDGSKLVDVIIVARGGGSLEDLWAFNEEPVVKAVFGCSVPVVSGVGHEVDITLCDLAADVRAPTPTAAAEMVVPRRGDLLLRVGELERRLSDTDRWFQPRVQRVDELTLRLETKLGGMMEEARLRVRAAEATLATIKPDRVLELLSSRISLLAQRLVRAGQASGDISERRIESLRERLSRSLPVESLASKRLVVDALAHRLQVGAARKTLDAHQMVRSLEQRLGSVNPQSVLERGFSIVSVEGRTIRSIDEAPLGARLEVTLADGLVSGTVTGREKGTSWRKQSQ